MAEKKELTEAQIEELRKIEEAEKEKKNKKSEEDSDDDEDEDEDGTKKKSKKKSDNDEEDADDSDEDEGEDEKETKKSNESVEAPKTFDALVEAELAQVRASRLTEDAENEHSDKEYYIYKDGKPVNDHDSAFESPAQAAEKAKEKDMGDDYYIVEYDTAKEEITDTLDIEGK